MDNRRRSQKTNEFIDTDRGSGADIVHFAGPMAFGAQQECLDRIADKREVSTLLAVPHHRQWLAGKQLCQKNPEYRTITAARARSRSVHIEKPQRSCWQPVDLRPMQNQLPTQ